MSNLNETLSFHLCLKVVTGRWQRGWSWITCICPQRPLDCSSSPGTLGYKSMTARLWGYWGVVSPISHRTSSLLYTEIRSWIILLCYNELFTYSVNEKSFIDSTACVFSSGDILITYDFQVFWGGGRWYFVRISCKSLTLSIAERLFLV